MASFSLSPEAGEREKEVNTLLRRRGRKRTFFQHSPLRGMPGWGLLDCVPQRMNVILGGEKIKGK
jgi:hypothetical protein